MKISDLVQLLEGVKREHGDILVICGRHRIAGVAIIKTPALMAHILTKPVPDRRKA